jgi:type IV pilus assembly protein PilQ
MAVGTMVLTDPSTSGELDLGGPPVTLTFRNVPALIALQALARIGGYGFIANSKNSTLETTDTVRGNTAGGMVERETSTKETKVASPPVSASFVREDFRTAFNLILTSAGLQAKLTPNGRTIIVGQNACGFGGGKIASKVYRLNQANPESAAHYLASLGSYIRIPRSFQTTESVGSSTNVGGGSSSGGQTSSNTTSTITRGTEIEAFGGQVGPLQGICGTIDKRLGTITLVGNPTLISVGEQYLKQIDLRQRQVALSIKILDVSLNNESLIDSSFACRFGNNFILNESGKLVAQFGRDEPTLGTPPTGSTTVTTSDTLNRGGARTSSSQTGDNSTITFTSSDFANLNTTQITNVNNSLTQEVTGTSFYNPQSRSFTFSPSSGGTGSASFLDSLSNQLQNVITRVTGVDSRRINTRSISDSNNSFANNNSITTRTSTNTTPIGGSSGSPADDFVSFLTAKITSGSTKVLASPTLVLSEVVEDSESSTTQSGSGGTFVGGSFINNTNTSNFIPVIGRAKGNESAVVVGEQVITSYNVQAGQNGAANTCQPVLGVAGLTFGAKVSKIDDNGFVTFKLSPSISAAIDRQEVRGCGFIDILALRSIDTGASRVRDGQTLILTGVITDRDNQIVAKWPVLGDIPIIGQFFRQSNSNREKRELVVMVTPRIINDTEGGTYGYGYEPSTATRGSS